MLALAHRISAFFSRARMGNALSFVIIVPCWKSDEGWKALAGYHDDIGDQHPWIRYHLVLSKCEHGFMQGAQHIPRKMRSRNHRKKWKNQQRKQNCSNYESDCNDENGCGRLHRISTCDTSVLFWQNDEGAHKWPVTNKAIAEVIQAFARKDNATQIKK